MAHQAFVGEEGSCIGKATTIPRYKTERGGIGIIHIPKRALVEGRAQMRETAPLHGNPRIACIPRIVHAHKDKLHQTFPEAVSLRSPLRTNTSRRPSAT